MHIGIYEKYPLFFSDLTVSWTFLNDFRKVLISSFIRILSVEAELYYAELRADGHRVDMTKPRVAFKHFANAPKKDKNCKIIKT
jgi:hypothetical protein